MKDRTVLAYSGGAASSAAIRRLVDAQATDVVTVTLDLGAGIELQEIHERALAFGAVRAHVVDVSDEFADHYLLPALQTGALDGRPETLDVLARPLIAKKLIEIARIERAVAVAHGAPAGSGLDALIQAIDADVRIVGAASKGPGPRETGSGVRDHVVPAAAPRKSASGTPDNGADVEMTFDRDVPVAINGVPMSLTELIESLTVIAVQHGISGTGGFARAPALTVLRVAFDARSRDEATNIVRLKLQNGVTTAAVVPGSELAAPRS